MLRSNKSNAAILSALAAMAMTGILAWMAAFQFGIAAPRWLAFGIDADANQSFLVFLVIPWMFITNVLSAFMVFSLPAPRAKSEAGQSTR